MLGRGSNTACSRSPSILAPKSRIGTDSTAGRVVIDLDLTKNLTTIGKPGLQVAVITKRPNGYFITHVEGATFPTLNGASMGGQAHALGDHDLIEIAGVKMEFFYKP